MVKVKISKQAQTDMRRIYNYVYAESVQNADMLIEKFISKIDVLKVYPQSGKIVKEISNPSVREISVYKFRIIYRLYSKTVRIITIHHSSRLLINNPFMKNYLK